MNKVILMGRLTRDPDIRYSGSGEGSMCVAKFTLAVDRRRTTPDGQREADFISCTAFGKQAEFAEKFLHQGTKITLSGRIQTGSYTNREGQKVYTTDVVIEEMEFAESKGTADNRQGSFQGNYQRPAAPQPQYQQSAPQYQQPAQPQYQAQPQQQWQEVPQQPARPEPVIPANEFERPIADESAVGQGFMNIPEGVEDEGLPFN
ncbi:MAG: single-stranded DNA-binding protein [Lachnospiraceae bacterium]|nr:single-stranded DNA-binding protein [Lachnospiraceae bacterium]